MEKNEYFKEALSNFTFEAASGGAIRHLADSGYTARQIIKMLDFPTSYERIQDEMWKHFVDNGTLILEESGIGRINEAYAYVTEYDTYGRKSFRRIRVRDKEWENFCWKKRIYQEDRDGPVKNFLASQCEKNKERDAEKAGEGGQIRAYISCDFGLQIYHNREELARSLTGLEETDREYLLGLPWEKRRVYHRLDARMRRITAELYRGEHYQADAYFIRTREKIRIEGRGTRRHLISGG